MKIFKIYAMVITVSFVVLLVKYSKVMDESRAKEVDLNFIQGGDITCAEKIDSLEKRCDSLYWELFPVQNELGRYEIALDILRERNPKAAQQYSTIISEETE